MNNALIEALFAPSGIDDAFIARLSQSVQNNPYSELLRNQYIKTLVSYARELIDKNEYHKARSHLNTANELAHIRHPLKFIIACYQLEISEQEAQRLNSMRSQPRMT